ncbi:MAG: HD domain-containing protein [Nevskiaceae bacterium]|nr:MAG: HD domain-containing protein [Nevskiaceae bacterium]
MSSDIAQPTTATGHARQYGDRALQTLLSANRALLRAEQVNALYQEMCRIIVETGGYAMAWIGIARHDPGRSVDAVAHYGDRDGYLRDLRISWADVANGRGPTGTAIRTESVQINHDFECNPRMEPWRERARSHGYRSSLSIPLRDERAVFGALTLYAREPDAFDGAELELLNQLAEDLSHGVRHLRLRQEHAHNARLLRRSLFATIEALTVALEKKDPFTAGHQRRVSRLSARIARELGVSDFDIEGIRIAAQLHDVGMIQVPSELLVKTGPLTPDDYDLIRRHARAGFDILEPIDFPWPVAEMVHQHHERIDGGGYPRGLRGERILLGARIIAVADTAVAMNTAKPYRETPGPDATLQALRDGRGTAYDPAVVDACLHLLRDLREAA